MDKNESFYILKRKFKSQLYGLVFIFCRLFPIKSNKIVFWAFEGTRGYCCAPKYVADELLHRANAKKDSYELVWLVKNTNHQFPEGIKKVQDNWWNRAYHLSTASIWVGNSRTFFGTQKRKKQIYIQTWHGTICIKPIGRYRKELFPKIAEIVSQADSNLIDYVISNSKWCDTHYPDGLLYKGEILRTGMPRCDILFNTNHNIISTIKSKFDIPTDAKVMMYAPTFRGGSQETNRSVSDNNSTIDFSSLITTLEERFGGTWYILLRLHPQIAAKNLHFKTDEISERLRDATQHQDMNELIASVDGFITDYSSAIFEAFLTDIPCFIYADDLEEYTKERGDLFFDLKKLPFPLATTDSQLLKNIQLFDEQKYITQTQKLKTELDIIDDGSSASRVADLIEKLLKGGN